MARPPKPLPMMTAFSSVSITYLPWSCLHVRLMLRYQGQLESGPVFLLHLTILQYETENSPIDGWGKGIRSPGKVRHQDLEVFSYRFVPAQEEGKEAVACQPQVPEFQVLRVSPTR